MEMNIKVVLVEYEDRTDIKVYASSGILINNKYVLITSNILRNLFKNEPTKTTFNGLAEGVLHFDTLTDIKPRINVISKAPDNFLYTVNQANIFATFISRNVKKSAKLLNDWSVDYKASLGHLNDILPYFFILRIVNINDTSESDLHSTLLEWFNILNTRNLNKGDDLFIDSVPFGHRSFINSYSKGIISNILGDESCLMLSDCASAPGSEGSPVYHSRFKQESKVPVGVVISSLNWWRGEWIGLTLIGNIRPLLTEILNINYNDRIQMWDAKITNCKILATVKNSLAQIYCGENSWGTGIVLCKKKGLFITNSHVIESNKEIKVCIHNHCIKSKLVYKTPNGTVFDAAVIKCDPKQLENINITDIVFTKKPLERGDAVFCGGYALFKKDSKISPTISKGHIMQYDQAMLKTSCCVLPGASGGAVLNCEGELVGIIVCNTKLQESQAAYTRFNMAIPILAIQDILKAYIVRADSKILTKLHVTNTELVKHWTCLESKL